eukprot:CAMPEP_0197526222 /NCGR_PEP_ID=MMETSP1318-20131121/16816_1 /TAXON_ID=552666 /ORGANISM="Partenskyella glossopodia, Strain RCC365" /LENGTH=360 /DNA_ID=CAMNT_0043080287 /DNA_START=282 /DNA_END=1364 /DNA_ORIENTATION=+
MHQWAWAKVNEIDVDAWVWLGDTVYGDLQDATFSLFGAQWETATPDFLRMLYGMQRKIPGYAQLIDSGVPIFGTWDDHDFGEDNADMTYAYRADSQKEFLDFLDEPIDSPRRSQEGVYATHTIDNGRIRLILLDVRYHRTPYGDGPEGDFLGEKQWMWLEKTLRDSQAEVNLIGGGIQFLASRTILGIPITESWARFPAARKRLLETILNSGAEAPVLLSGDVHLAEISEAVCKPKGLLLNHTLPETKIVEVTSSGLTHSLGTDPWIVRKLFDGVLSLHQRNLAYQAEPLYSGMNFAELEFSLEGEDNLMSVNIHGQDSLIAMSRSYNLVDLTAASSRFTPRPGLEWECKGINEEWSLEL